MAEEQTGLTRKRERSTGSTSDETAASQVQKKSCTRATRPDDYVFNDSVHGTIRLHPLLVKIIDTPEFQRLRDIKQLGGCYFVYPGASHNRFEHSLGVAHLAGKLARKLMKSSKLIDEKDVLCVEIAGLCHDLGHGPFSHLWERFVERRTHKKWKHEECSVKMLHYLIEKNDLNGDFQKYELDENDRIFIDEMIDSKDPTKGWSYHGRDKKQSFLYEIVSNQRNGVDVDKWDYFKRDCHHLGFPCQFDVERAIEFARVSKLDGQNQICFRDKEAENMYEMFQTRLSLHRKAYQHKTSNAVELMLTEALILADPVFNFTKGREAKDTEDLETECIALADMHAFTELNDHIIHQILTSSAENLKKSKELLLRIRKRDLYKCIGEVRYSERNEEKLIEEIAEISVNTSIKIEVQDLEIDTVEFSFGFGKKNPVNYIEFYSKEKPDEAKIILSPYISKNLPNKFQEKIIRVYCKCLGKFTKAQQCFNDWVQGGHKDEVVFEHTHLLGGMCVLHPADSDDVLDYVIAEHEREIESMSTS